MFYYPRNWVNILSTRFWGMAQLSTMTTTPGKMLVVGSRPERMMTRAKSKGKGCVWGTINEIEIQNKITPNDKFKGKFLPAEIPADIDAWFPLFRMTKISVTACDLKPAFIYKFKLSCRLSLTKIYICLGIHHIILGKSGTFWAAHTFVHIVQFFRKSHLDRFHRNGPYKTTNTKHTKRSQDKKED